MGKHFARLEQDHREFIERQQIFFNASAASHGRVNVSLRDVAALRILDNDTVLYQDRTGSGNETAAHLLADGRLTLMFCAFEGRPLVLRLYGRGRVVARHSTEYRDLLATHYGDVEVPGARQIVRLDIQSVQTSCGMNVPFYSFLGQRHDLTRWAEAKGEPALEEYRREKNAASIDGFPTGMFETVIS